MSSSAYKDEERLRNIRIKNLRKFDKEQEAIYNIKKGKYRMGLWDFWEGLIETFFFLGN